jgi:hypothetical protein
MLPPGTAAEAVEAHGKGGLVETFHPLERAPLAGCCAK